MTFTEQRNNPRQKSLLRGFVYFGCTGSAIDCLVRDICDTGARLKFSAAIPMIDTLDLRIPIKGQTLKAKVVWRNEYEIGVAFVGAFDAGNSASGDAVLADRVARLEAEIATLRQLLKKLTKNSNRKIEAA